MDLAILLPLAAMLAMQALIGLALLLPYPASKPMAKLLATLSTHTASKSALLTVAGAVGAMTLSATIQLVGIMGTLKTSRTRAGDMLLGLTADELRPLLALVLGIANLELLFLSRALAMEQLSSGRARTNLDAMQRQAKGMQAEYDRATADAPSGAAGAVGGGGEEAARLRGELEALQKDKAALQAAVEEASEDRRGAMAQVEAIKEQSKGLEREYDRLLAEHDQLRRNYEQATGGRIAVGGMKAE